MAKTVGCLSIFLNTPLWSNEVAQMVVIMSTNLLTTFHSVCGVGPLARSPGRSTSATLPSLSLLFVTPVCHCDVIWAPAAPVSVKQHVTNTDVDPTV